MLHGRMVKSSMAKTQSLTLARSTHWRTGLPSAGACQALAACLVWDSAWTEAAACSAGLLLPSIACWTAQQSSTTCRVTRFAKQHCAAQVDTLV